MTDSCSKQADRLPTATWRAGVDCSLAMATFRACALRCDPSQIPNSGFSQFGIQFGL